MADVSDAPRPSASRGSRPDATSGNDAPQIWDALKDDVGGLADVALQQGRQIVDTARDQATTFADERKGFAAQAVSDIAATLRDSSKSLEQQPNLHGFVATAADGLDQLADTIRSRSFGEIYTDVEDVIRKRPVLTATAALVAGFIAARFIKSSGEELAAKEMRRRAESDLRGGSGRQPGSSPRAGA